MYLGIISSLSAKCKGHKAKMSSNNKAEIPHYNKKSLGSYAGAFPSSFRFLSPPLRWNYAALSKNEFSLLVAIFTFHRTKAKYLAECGVITKTGRGAVRTRTRTKS